MRSITKEEAQKILLPHLERVRRAIINSINFYYSGDEYAKTRHRHSARTHASICHDLIISAIEREFDGVPGTYFVRRRGLFMLIIDGMIVLRFKKFGRNLLANGINTQQTIAFNSQEPEQLELAGMPPDGLLYAGYNTNKLQTGLQGIYITSRYKNSNRWVWDITVMEDNMKTFEFPGKQTKTPTRKVSARRKESDVGDSNAINNE